MKLSNRKITFGYKTSAIDYKPIAGALYNILSKEKSENENRSNVIEDLQLQRN